MPSFYHITITNSGNRSAPADGFIDPVRIEKYVPNLEAPPTDFTLAASTAKRRGNLRFVEMVGQLGFSGNVYLDLGSVVSPGASYKAEPSSFTVTAWVEHGDGSLRTRDETTGSAFLTGAAALTRMVARALIISQDFKTDVFDPTALPTPGNTKAVPRFGSRIMTVTVGALAANLASATSMVSVIKVV